VTRVPPGSSPPPHHSRARAPASCGVGCGPGPSPRPERTNGGQAAEPPRYARVSLLQPRDPSVRRTKRGQPPAKRRAPTPTPDPKEGRGVGARIDRATALPPKGERCVSPDRRVPSRLHQGSSRAGAHLRTRRFRIAGAGFGGMDAVSRVVVRPSGHGRSFWGYGAPLVPLPPTRQESRGASGVRAVVCARRRAGSRAGALAHGRSA
jgi:hypothetical protein